MSVQGFPTRLSQILQERSMTKKDLGAKLKVSPQLVSGWTNGSRTPQLDDFASLCELLSVSPAWLLTGEADNPRAQTIVKDDVVIIPLLETRASCGNGNAVYPVSVSEVSLIKVNTPWVNRYCGDADIRALNLLGITGDSMRPTLEDGDFVIIDTSIKTIYTDSMFAFTLEGDMYIKRLQRFGKTLQIISDNDKYPTLTINLQEYESRLRILGRVVTTCLVRKN